MKTSDFPSTIEGPFETNTFGVVAVTNAMLPLLRRSEAGRIANVSSGLGTVAFLGDPDESLRQYALLLGYNASKAALNAITLMYAMELRDTAIKVNAVSPGFAATDLNDHRGVISAEEGGAHVARLALVPDDGHVSLVDRPRSLEQCSGMTLWEARTELEVAEFAVACRDKGVPAEVRDDVVDHVLDVLGACLAAYKEPGPDVLRAVRRWSGTQEATVVGSGDRLPAPSVALVNGTLAHASVVPAALAAAEASGVDGAALITAIAAGIEVSTRLGGVCGAAVSAGLVLGLPVEGIADAIAVASGMGAEAANRGWAAHAGMTAAVLAVEGVSGPTTVLEARIDGEGWELRRVGGFAENAGKALPPEQVAALEQAVRALPDAESLSEMLARTKCYSQAFVSSPSAQRSRQ